MACGGLGSPASIFLGRHQLIEGAGDTVSLPHTQNIRERFRSMRLEGDQQFDLHILEAGLRTTTTGRGGGYGYSAYIPLGRRSTTLDNIRRWRQSI